MCRQALASSLKKIVIERVGCDVNIHLMRHRAAVAYLKIYPGEFGIVAELLGHKTDKTARKSYTGPERDAAFNRFDESVLDAMKSLKRANVPKHRRARANTRVQHAASARSSAASSSAPRTAKRATSPKPRSKPPATGKKGVAE